MQKNKLSPEDFVRLSQFIQDTWGLKMPPSKKVMLEGRLSKRLRRLGMNSFDEYCSYLFSQAGLEDELPCIIDVVSTNKTDFFREPQAFSYMLQTMLPELVTGKGAGTKERLMVWSAACSTGEEPYTLAMVISEFALKYPGLQFDFSILATDISSKVLKEAKRAVYHQDRVEPIPLELRYKYLLRSKEREKKMVRVAPELRAKVRFHRLNLMDDFGMPDQMHVIFCRNVIIYFEQATQKRLLARLCDRLNSRGYLVMGHAETLHGMSLPLEAVAPMIYQKKH